MKQDNMDKKLAEALLQCVIMVCLGSHYGGYSLYLNLFQTHCVVIGLILALSYCCGQLWV